MGRVSGCLPGMEEYGDGEIAVDIADSYLLFAPYCLKAEEELKWVDEVALAQDRSRYDCCCPPTSHHRDVKEPLF